MRVTHIGHAAILIESGGCRILSDPWWEGPCFGTQWWVYPPPHVEAVKNGPIDYIYISHGHHDHLHLGTLRRIPGAPKLLVSKEEGLAPGLRNAGFEVIEIARSAPLTLDGGIRADLRPTLNHDTLLVIDDGLETCANLNDAVHPLDADQRAKILSRLKADYPRLDYVFCGYGMASHFPACYNAPGVDRCATVVKRQAHFNLSWCDIIASLEPRFGFPFAADVAFLEERLFWVNEAAHNHERVTDRFKRNHPDHPTQVIDIAPGFRIENGRVVTDARFQPVSAERLREDHAEGIAVCARTPKLPDMGICRLAEMLDQKVALYGDYLREFRDDYRIVIEITGADQAITIAKHGDTIETALVDHGAAGVRDLTFRTKFGYLRRALTEAFGHEVLFVGSGCEFIYHDRRRLSEALHRELKVLLNAQSTPPSSRYGDQPKWLYDLKMSVKRLTGSLARGRGLDEWLVFEQH